MINLLGEDPFLHPECFLCLDLNSTRVSNQFTSFSLLSIPELSIQQLVCGFTSCFELKQDGDARCCCWSRWCCFVVRKRLFCTVCGASLPVRLSYSYVLPWSFRCSENWLLRTRSPPLTAETSSSWSAIQLRAFFVRRCPTSSASSWETSRLELWPCWARDLPLDALFRDTSASRDRHVSSQSAIFRAS